jgi:hypothetical protein
MNDPKYSYPPGRFVQAALDLVLARRRNLQQDAKACIESMTAEPKVLGEENIPARGRCVLTINHFHRPGFGAQWIALAVTALVPLDVRWAVTGELMCEGKWYRALGARASRIFLKRLAYMYGMTTMPPMPPRPRDVEARAAAVRAILEDVKHTSEPVLGISPEGFNPPNGVLTRPAIGFGRFALLLSKAGMRFIPVGGYEAEGILHVHFGKQYELSVPGGLSTDQKDEQAMQMIMRKIACLLPAHLRGEFA